MRDIIIALVVLLLVASCTNTKKNTDFDKGPILENLANNLAIPAYENSLEAFISLDSAIRFLDTYNTDYNLKVARDLWLAAATNWAETAPYNFGPIDDLLVENNFHYVPTDTSKIQSAITRYSGSENFISELGSNSRGLGALEYLLYKDSLTSKSLSFAKLLSKNLVKLNKEVLNQWKEAYAETFVSNSGNSINSSITIVTNQWIEVAEKVKSNKIGVPAGKMVGTEENVFAVPAPFSNTSLALITANVSALQASFTGKEGKGVDDYLNALDIKDPDGIALSDRVNATFNNLQTLLNEEGHTLTELIQQDDEQLDQIYLEALNLTILLRTDMMGQLGLITTFSDSDGD